MTSEMRADRPPPLAPPRATPADVTPNAAKVATDDAADSVFPGRLPDTIAAARHAGRPWAIRLACLWDTIERYATVRRRHDRLPAHHLVCSLADEVRGLGSVEVLDGRHDWAVIASRISGACDDPLGDDPLDAVTELVTLIHDLADDLAD